MDNSGGNQPSSGGYSRKERMERKMAEISSQDQIAGQSTERMQDNNSSQDETRYNQTFARAAAPLSIDDANNSSGSMNRKVGGSRTNPGDTSFSSSRNSGSNCAARC
jgi:hypothetical protein